MSQPEQSTSTTAAPPPDLNLTIPDTTAQPTTTTTTVATVGSTTMVLLANRAFDPRALDVLRQQGCADNTPVGQVPDDVWLRLLMAGGPLAAGALAPLNKFFQRLVRENGYPEGYESNKPETAEPQGEGSKRISADFSKGYVHVHTLAQLDHAKKLQNITWIVVHPGIDSHMLGASASTVPKTQALLLAAGVTATGITGGRVFVFNGAHATNISYQASQVADEEVSDDSDDNDDNDDAHVRVYAGGNASDIHRGFVDVNAGGNATDIHGGHTRVKTGGNASNIHGGTVYVLPGGNASNIHGGEVLDLDVERQDWMPRK